MRIARLLAVLVLAVAVSASAGDIRFKLIDQPPATEGRAAELSEEQLAALEMDLQGDAGAQLLQERNLTYLRGFYLSAAREGGFRSTLERIAQMRNEDVYIYLVNDTGGLNDDVAEHYGLCHYSPMATGEGSTTRYAWLYGQRGRSERALSVGEHYCNDFVTRFGELEGIESDAAGANSALAGMICSEMLRTWNSPDWQPNDIVVKPYDVREGRRMLQEHRTTRRYGSSIRILWTTLVGTRDGGEFRGVETLLFASSSGAARQLLGQFWDGGLLSVSASSALGRDLERRDALFNNFVGRGYDAYQWRNFTFSQIQQMELFSGIVLYYFCTTQPPLDDNYGFQANSLTQVLNYVEDSGEASLSLADILSALLFDHAEGREADRVSSRRLYTMALLQGAFGGTVEREELADFLDAAGFPENENTALLDEYFGEAGHYEAVRVHLRDNRTMASLNTFITERFRQQEFSVFQTAPQVRDEERPPDDRRR